MSRTIVCVFVQNSPLEKEFSVFHFVLRLRKRKGGRDKHCTCQSSTSWVKYPTTVIIYCTSDTKPITNFATCTLKKIECLRDTKYSNKKVCCAPYIYTNVWILMKICYTSHWEHYSKHGLKILSIYINFIHLHHTVRIQAFQGRGCLETSDNLKLRHQHWTVQILPLRLQSLTLARLHEPEMTTWNLRILANPHVIKAPFVGIIIVLSYFNSSR